LDEGLTKPTTVPADAVADIAVSEENLVPLTASLASDSSHLEGGQSSTSAVPDALQTSSHRKHAPQQLADLEAWLSEHSLQLSGSLDSSLLIVSEAMDGTAVETSSRLRAKTPFNPQSAQLFELMMRAINIRTTERYFGVLSTQRPSAESSYVRDFYGAIGPSTKAALLMVKDWDALACLDTAQDHHFRLTQASLPVWRIPHPDLLLLNASLKRQAWVCLQALQSVL